MSEQRSGRAGDCRTSVIFPVYECAGEVDPLIDLLLAAMEKSGRTFEIIIIDDGSKDTTWEECQTRTAGDKRFRLVKMRSHFGESAALAAGLNNASGEEIVFITGRVRVNPEGLPRLLEKLDAGLDLIVGWRHPRRDSLLNRVVSRIFNNMAHWISRVKLHDINSGVFVVRREVLGKISFYGDLFNFIPVLAAQQGYKIGEEKIEQLSGIFRRSRYPREYIRRLLDIITVFFLSRYSKKPNHFLGFLGTFLFLLGLGIEIYLFIYRILLLGPIAGRPLLLLGALLLVIGIQMISIGLLGEMIIFTHAGDIEEYNIEEIIN